MLFSFTKQPDAMDCGPACLRMIAEHYGNLFSDTIARNIAVSGDEIDLERLRYAARVA